MDVFVNKADQFCQVVIGFRTSNSHDDKQQLKSPELPQRATPNGFCERDESREERWQRCQHHSPAATLGRGCDAPRSRGHPAARPGGAGAHRAPGQGLPEHTEPPARLGPVQAATAAPADTLAVPNLQRSAALPPGQASRTATAGSQGALTYRETSEPPHKDGAADKEFLPASSGHVRSGKDP